MHPVKPGVTTVPSQAKYPHWNPAINRKAERREIEVGSNDDGLHCYYLQRKGKRFWRSSPDFPGCVTAGAV
jgi:hypothetical protein